MAIRRDTLRLIRQLRRDVGLPADEATRALTKAWVRAWDEIDASFIGSLQEVAQLAVTGGRWPQPWELRRVESLRAALAQADAKLVELAGKTATEATDAATSAVKATLEAEPQVIASQLPAAAQAEAAVLFAARIPANALDVIVARTTQQITALTRPLSADANAAMQRELVRGVAVGANPRETARRMVKRVEGAFNGGLNRALNVARTETLDAYRRASREAHTANAGVLAGWTWGATLDKRTCPSCWSRHGTVHPVDELGPLDHQQGRCARIPKVKSWRDLGIDLPEPDDLIPDAQTQFVSLPEGDQLAIMGPGRLELLRSGKASWDDLATRRTTAGWRDSFVPTPLKDLARNAARPAEIG